MITYFLPGHGIYGGIKVAYAFVDALNYLGIPARIASPDGIAETWFESTAPVVDREVAFKHATDSGVSVFSHPADFASLHSLPGKLVYHCQGTDPLVDTFVGSPELTVLTCWTQASEYCAARGAQPIHVGIPVSDAFFSNGRSKIRRSVSWMPRRGTDLGLNVLAQVQHLVSETYAIEELPEYDVARILQGTSIFLATSEGEYFGLPALEALAAGCVVVSVPVLGGHDYLERAGATIADQNRLAQALEEQLLNEDCQSTARRRLRGVATACEYSVVAARETLSKSLTTRWHLA
jgi:glycosyltransferase involved in cell wall biosynthesis